MRPHPILAASLALASACHTPPAPGAELALELRDDWQSESSAQVTTDAGAWWQSFADAELDAVVSEALEHNKDLALAAARLRAAAAQARIAEGASLPSVDAGLSRTRQQQVFVGFPVPGAGLPSSSSTGWGVNVNLRWEADLWGRLSAQERAAHESLLASALEREAARQSLAGQTVRAWLAWAEAREQHALAERTRTSFVEQEELVRARYQRGAVDALDLHLAQSNRSAADAAVEARAEILQRSVRQLELLLGRYPAGELSGPRALPVTPPVPPSGVPVELLARRPDLAAAEARARAAVESGQVARAELYPQLSITASGGRLSDELGDLLDGDFTVWSLVAGVTQPLFDGGRLREAVELADAQTEEANAVWTSAVLRALTEVETALAVEAQLARRERALERAASESRAANELTRERYAGGLEDIFALLQSERRSFESESAYIGARRARLDARVDLHLALGGGFGTPANESEEDDAR